jgi:hypothetical protein
MDTYSSVPHPDQRNDSIEFAWNNPGSLVGFPYTRHMHHWTTDLSPHGAVIIRELPPTGPFRLGIKWFSAGGAARPGASVSLYRNGSLLKRSYLSLAPTDGTSGNRVWALYSLSSDGTIGMPGTDPNGLRSDYGAWIHRNNDIPGLPGPAAGQTVQGQLDGIAEDSVSMPLTDIVDVYNVALAAGQTYTFTLSGPADTNFDLYLFGPSSFSIYDSFPIAGSTGPTSQETFAFTVPPDAGGRYYLVLYAFQGAGTYTLSRP